MKRVPWLRHIPIDRTMTQIAFTKKIVFSVCITLCLLLFFESCKEDYVSNLPVIEEELIGEYLQNNPNQFSEFTKMLDTTGVLGLLNAYGLYTVFAPTNQAVKEYLATFEDENGLPYTSISQIPIADIKAFCFNHIIKGDTIHTEDFSKGALGSQTMGQHFLSITYSDTSRTIYVNGKSPIIERDIERHNGIIHVMGMVLAPSRLKIGEIFEGDTLFTIYGQALKKTGLSEIMNLAPSEDESFDPKADTRSLNGHTVTEERPISRKFGYTILGVSDADLANFKDCPSCPNGVSSFSDLEKVAAYYYAEVFNHDADNVSNKYLSDGVTLNPEYDLMNKKNYLNRFMSFHCFDRILLNSRFVKDYFTPHHFDQYPMFEYIETMLENTLIEVVLDKRGTVIGKTRFSNSNYIYGVFNIGDPIQGCMLTKYQNKPDGGSLNGYYHGINKPVIYSKKYVAELSTKRLRLEGCSYFPEIASNNMRGNNPEAVAGVVGKTHAYLIPNGYITDFVCSANTRFTYIGACAAYEDYQGDEIYLVGTYNFTIKTCPIPAGTYEVRMAYQPTAYRGIAQLYLDSLPCGIPLNLSLLANDPNVGHEVPGTTADDPYGYENDKMMHNRGYMKGADSFHCFDNRYYNPDNTARTSTSCLRVVLGTYTFAEPKKHYFTVISLGTTSSSTQFMLDYLEFCPIELLETEDIY